MPTRDVIVVGASAGGVEALDKLVRLLPAGLPASIFVVVHFPANSTSALPQILSRAGRLPARHPSDGEAIQRGQIYVAPPNWHLVLHQGSIRVVFGPRQHGFRPAIDPLFFSAAQEFGARVVGVVLSGTLSDGAAGIQDIKRAGGAALVQDPHEAMFPYLPLKAIESTPVDEILTVSQIAHRLNELAGEEVPEREIKTMTDENNLENLFVQEDIQSFTRGETPNNRSVLTCPECGGVTWELHEGPLMRYRCHVGHIFSDDSMLAEQGKALENGLWTAVRALEERAALLDRLASQAKQRESVQIAGRFHEQAREAERQAETIRQVLASGKTIGLEFEPRASAALPDSDDGPDAT
jgi:two-component system chemotaxis response regulator CheB